MYGGKIMADDFSDRSIDVDVSLNQYQAISYTYVAVQVKALGLTTAGRSLNKLL